MGRPMHPAKAAALAAGNALYHTGQACNLGGVAGRTVEESKCQCDAHRAKRAENAERRYLRDKAQRIASAATWAQENPEAKKKAAREWAARNGNAVRAQTHKRRATQINATPPWFDELDELVMREAVDLAKRRTAATGFPWEVDHEIPLRGRNVCGLHVHNNIQVIPRAVNRRKSNSHTVA